MNVLKITRQHEGSDSSRLWSCDWLGCTELFNFDLGYSHPKAFFQTPFMSLGFAPEGQSSYTFPKVVGKQHANRPFLGAERLSAEEMYTSGMVTQVIGKPEDSREVFVEEVTKIAKRIGEIKW